MSLDSTWSLIAFDIGVDLGTANTLVYLKGKGVVLQEPTVVARYKKSKSMVAVGGEAKQMMGKTPPAIDTVLPVTDGVVADFEATQSLIAQLLRQAQKENKNWRKFSRPRVIVGVPSLATGVERKSVIDAIRQAGARKVILVDEAVASALGSGLLTGEASGRLLIDIGGGTTEMAIVSLDGLVANRSVPIGGWEMDQAIIGLAREKYQLLIGDQTAEYVKIQVGQAWDQEKKRTVMLRGRDLVSGLPKAVRVAGEEVQETLQPLLLQLREMAHELLEESPPELAADISRVGGTLSGGGSLMPGIAEFFADGLKMKMGLAEEPLTGVIKGTSAMLEDSRLLELYAWKESEFKE